MEKLDMYSKDIISENIKKIEEIFPNIIVTDKDGNLKVDIELLEQELSNELINSKNEKYQLNWPGKKESLLLANSKTSSTLRPLVSKSVNFDKTQNVYIEGDNLEVLKILQESYLNKIKCIYIDPPYNTGGDFLYNDDFKTSEDEELEQMGAIDEEGNRLYVNNSYSGRFHSKWLSMMYPRLKLAKNLLTKDGLIFISIDDNELYNLKKLCDEVFGEANYMNTLVIETGSVFGTKAAFVNKRYVKVKDYILVYNMGDSEINPLYQPLSNMYDTHYGNYIDENGKIIPFVEIIKKEKELSSYFEKYGMKISLNNIEKLMLIDEEFKKLINEKYSKNVYTSHSISVAFPEHLKSELKEDEVLNYNGKLYNKNSNGTINVFDNFESCLKPNKNGELVRSAYRGDLWKGFQLETQNADIEGGVYLKNGKKPVQLIRDIIYSVTNKDDIVMDFFSGSATTAEAVMNINASDEGNRKFILVQLPEKITKENVNKKLKIQYNFETMCDLGEQRVKNCIEKYNYPTNGVRIFKVDSSNMRDVYYKPSETSQMNLLDYISNIKDDRTPEDLLIQVMLDLGLTLDLKIEEKKIQNNVVYFVEGNSLIACFDDVIDINIVDELCKCNPMKVVFKDTSFKTDKDKINLEEKIKKLSPDTEVSIL